MSSMSDSDDDDKRFSFQRGQTGDIVGSAQSRISEMEQSAMPTEHTDFPIFVNLRYGENRFATATMDVSTNEKGKPQLDFRVEPPMYSGNEADLRIWIQLSTDNDNILWSKSIYAHMSEKWTATKKDLSVWAKQLYAKSEVINERMPKVMLEKFYLRNYNYNKDIGLAEDAKPRLATNILCFLLQQPQVKTFLKITTDHTEIGLEAVPDPQENMLKASVDDRKRLAEFYKNCLGFQYDESFLSQDLAPGAKKTPAEYFDHVPMVSTIAEVLRACKSTPPSCPQRKDLVKGDVIPPLPKNKSINCGAVHPDYAESLGVINDIYALAKKVGVKNWQSKPKDQLCRELGDSEPRDWHKPPPKDPNEIHSLWDWPKNATQDLNPTYDPESGKVTVEPWFQSSQKELYMPEMTYDLSFDCAIGPADKNGNVRVKWSNNPNETLIPETEARQIFGQAYKECKAKKARSVSGERKAKQRQLSAAAAAATTRPKRLLSDPLQTVRAPDRKRKRPRATTEIKILIPAGLGSPPTGQALPPTPPPITKDLKTARKKKVSRTTVSTTETSARISAPVEQQPTNVDAAIADFLQPSNDRKLLFKTFANVVQPPPPPPQQTTRILSKTQSVVAEKEDAEAKNTPAQEGDCEKIISNLGENSLQSLAQKYDIDLWDRPPSASQTGRRKTARQLCQEINKRQDQEEALEIIDFIKQHTPRQESL